MLFSYVILLLHRRLTLGVALAHDQNLEEDHKHRDKDIRCQQSALKLDMEVVKRVRMRTGFSTDSHGLH